jgi:hypothetical protein
MVKKMPEPWYRHFCIYEWPKNRRNHYSGVFAYKNGQKIAGTIIPALLHIRMAKKNRWNHVSGIVTYKNGQKIAGTMFLAFLHIRMTKKNH